MTLGWFFSVCCEKSAEGKQRLKAKKTNLCIFF